MTIQTALPELATLLGDRFHVSDAVRTQHGQNESYFPVTLPDGVAYPASTKEVADIVKICAQHNCPIVAWGVGTSLEGHALAIQGGITLNMTQMDKILSVNSDDLNVVIQPGITREALNADLRDTGLFFPIDPGANATLGGMTATSASGTTAVRYGTLKDNVLALEVVLADGRIIRTGTQARKSSAGYNLTNLFVGSEGTLGIITEITLKLYGQPEAIGAATCSFETIDAAVQSVITTIQMGIPVARMELLDATMVGAINSYSGMDLPVQPHLFLEFHGSESGVAEQSQMVGEIVADLGGSAFEWTTQTEKRNALWKARHNAYFAMKALRPGCEALTTDVCVPISKLAEAILQTAQDIEDEGLIAPIVGHAGDGNFHASILVDPSKPQELERAKTLAHRMNERALALGGTVTGEHGVGMGKMKYMEAQHGDAWGLMATVKRSFDPQNILNPGKIVQVN